MILLAIALLQAPFAVNGPPQVSQAEVSPYKANTDPPAKPTDGTEPTYTTEPVTQKIPHCYAGQKLMEFRKGVCYGFCGSTDPGWQSMQGQTQDRWEDVTGPTDDFLEMPRIFRCFKDESWTGPTTASVSSMCIDETCLEADPLAVRVGKRWSAFLPKGDPKPNQQIVCDVMTPNTTLYSCHWK